MFKFITDTVESAEDIVVDVATGEVPEKKDIVQLASAGVSAVVIAETLDVSLDLVEKVLSDDA